MISAVETVEHPLEVPLLIHSFQEVCFPSENAKLANFDQRQSEILLHYDHSFTVFARKLITYQPTNQPSKKPQPSLKLVHCACADSQVLSLQTHSRLCSPSKLRDYLPSYFVFIQAGLEAVEMQL